MNKNNNIGFNTYIYNLKTDLVNTVNKSGLPVGVVYYIIKDLFMDAQNAYEQTLRKEKEEALKKEEEEVECDDKEIESSYKKVEK